MHVRAPQQQLDAAAPSHSEHEPALFMGHAPSAFQRRGAGAGHYQGQARPAGGRDTDAADADAKTVCLHLLDSLGCRAQGLGCRL